MTNDCKICEVTVYNDRALVIRRGTVSLNGEQQEIAIAGLPLTVNSDSVTARCSGKVPVQLLAVRTERIFATEPFEQRLLQLQARIRQLEEQKRSQEDRMSSVELQRTFVEGLSEKYVDRFSSNFTSEQLNLNEIQELLNFIGQHHHQYAQTIAECERQLADIEKKLEALRQQLKQLQQPINKQLNSSVSIIVTLKPSEPGDFELEVSYLVNQAIWTPFYDLRTSSTDNKINLSYLAEVRQKTGEDWRGVALTLSTAKPSLNTQPPKVEPWYITGSKTQTSTQRNLKVNDDEFGELEALLADENDKSKKQELLQAQKVVSQATQSEGVVTFRLDRNSNIPSDGAPHKVTIYSGHFTCYTEYVALPRLIGFAYLEARIINSSNGLTLQPGKANIFRDNTLIGTTQLENIAPGQEFKLNLGIDQGLEIKRDLVEREIKIIGNYRRTTYGYKLIITNLRNQKTKLRLIEQLPVSRDEQIKVCLTATHPEIQLGEMGELEWLLTLQPQSKRQSKRELYYQFTLEHPSEITVESLDI